MNTLPLPFAGGGFVISINPGRDTMKDLELTYQKELSKLVAGDVVCVHQKDGAAETATVVRLRLFPIVESDQPLYGAFGGRPYEVTYMNDVTGAQGSYVGSGDDLVAIIDG